MSSEAEAKIPQFKMLAEKLRENIRVGDLKPGDRLPSWSQMQRDYGVHTSTIERAQKELAAEGLLVSRQGSGTFVASRSTPVRKGVIGLSGAGFSFHGYSSYWAQIMGGVQDAASSVGLQVLVLDSKSHVGWEKADGILVCGWDDRQKFPDWPPGLPLVSLLMSIEGMASVVADDASGAREATECLIQLGHRRIAYLHAYEDFQSIAWRRLSGYRDALQAAGIPALREWQHRLYGEYYAGAQFTDVAAKSMEYWLRHGWRELGCTALLCHNDEAALGAMQALGAAGIRVPEDVSIVGFDGTEFCDLVSPKLSSAQVPLREIGAAGVEMLLKQIQADAISNEHRVLPVQFKERETTAAPQS